MPPVSGRARKERELAEALAKMLGRQFREFRQFLREASAFADLPPEFWNQGHDDLLKILRQFGMREYLASAEQMLDELGVGIEWGVVNQAAADFAEGYSFGLVRDINETTIGAINRLQSSINAFFEQQLTLGELTDLLSGTFGPSRAATIARTEITRAAVEGEMGSSIELRNNGFNLEAFWQTNRQNECQICQALDGRQATGYDGDRRPYWELDGVFWGPPPSPHPNCDCSVGWSLVSGRPN